jgi:hypothetical protein
MKNLEQIAKAINDKISDYDGKGNLQEKSFAELIFALKNSETVKKLKSSDDTNRRYTQLFPHFATHENRLIVGTLGEGGDLENVATILQDRNKLAFLANIATSDVTTSDLETIANFFQDAEKLKSVIDFIKNTNFEVTKHSKIYEDRTGNFETSSEHNKLVGQWGENFINDVLIKQKNESKIIDYEWYKDTTLPYDFTVKTKDGIKYIDVKATEELFETPIGITRLEVREIFKQQNNYFIYRVYSVDLNKKAEINQAKYSRHKPFDRLVKDLASLLEEDYPNGIAISLDKDTEEIE